MERVCEAASGVRTLVVDLESRAPAPQHPPVDVQVRFTLNEQPWPNSKTARRAGTFALVAPDGARTELDVPASGNGTITTQLLPQTYQGTISLGSDNDADGETFPTQVVVGWFVVKATGTVIIDFRGTLVDYTVAVDGTGLDTLVRGESGSLVFKSSDGMRTAYQQLKPGMPVARRLMMHPGHYTAELSVKGSMRMPTGSVRLTPDIDATIPAPIAVALAARSFPIGGSITVDGADLPQGAAGTVTFGAVQIPVPSARPARYSGRIWDGAHNVTLSVLGTPMLAATTAQVAAAFTAGPSTLDIPLMTAPITAEVTLNGSRLPDWSTSRGSLWIGGSTFDLGTYGPAVVTGRVLAGAQEARVVGDTASQLLPASIVVDPQFRPSGARQVIDVRAGVLRLDTTYNGQPPPDSANSRGYYQLTASDGSSAYEIASSKGPMTATLVLPVGNWVVKFFAERQFTEIPDGSIVLGNVELTASGAQKSFNIVGFDFVVALRRDGQPLDSPTTGDRGVLAASAFSMVDGAVTGNLSTKGRIPAAGTSDVRLKLVPGIWTFFYQCDATCGLVEIPFRFLASGLRLQ